MLDGINEQTDNSPQFDIAGHYDVMAQLDRDVHDNEELSLSEVDMVLRLLGEVPKQLFLPCFGTGRHIKGFLQAGVEQIVGVDLSPQCVAKAQSIVGDDSRVVLEVGDLTNWTYGNQFDASVLLGNSYADCIDPDLLSLITNGMVKSLRPGGKFVMDYIGENYLDLCKNGKTNTWEAMLDGNPVLDSRTPSYNEQSNVMTIDITCRSAENHDNVVWQGSYQKLILARQELEKIFDKVGISLSYIGRAIEINRYLADHQSELGMIAKADWWMGSTQ